ncbi:heat shock protein Pss1 [Orobanche gracilis]
MSDQSACDQLVSDRLVCDQLVSDRLACDQLMRSPNMRSTSEDRLVLLRQVYFVAQQVAMEVIGRQKSRQKDHVTYHNGDGSTLNIEDELDPWTAWAYKPQTITLLLIGACLLVWASGAIDPERCSGTDIVTSVKRGVWAMIVVFLAYSLLQAPSTVLTRPHPAIWRLVHGTAVIYLVALTFLLFQRRDDARQFMKLLHPDLGIELPERSYGTDCRFYVPENPTSRFKNVYVFGLGCVPFDILTVKLMSGSV